MRENDWNLLLQQLHWFLKGFGCCPLVVTKNSHGSVRSVVRQNLLLQRHVLWNATDTTSVSLKTFIFHQVKYYSKKHAQVRGQGSGLTCSEFPQLILQRGGGVERSKHFGCESWHGFVQGFVEVDRLNSTQVFQTWSHVTALTLSLTLNSLTVILSNKSSSGSLCSMNSFKLLKTWEQTTDGAHTWPETS